MYIFCVLANMPEAFPDVAGRVLKTLVVLKGEATHFDLNKLNTKIENTIPPLVKYEVKVEKIRCILPD